MSQGGAQCHKAERSVALHWIGLDWIGLQYYNAERSFTLDWFGSDRSIGLDWIGLGWVGLDWIPFHLAEALFQFIYELPILLRCVALVVEHAHLAEAVTQRSIPFHCVAHLAEAARELGLDRREVSQRVERPAEQLGVCGARERGVGEEHAVLREASDSACRAKRRWCDGGDCGRCSCDRSETPDDGGDCGRCGCDRIDS